MSSQFKLPDKVPLLPGHVFQDHLKQNHHKTQQFSLQQGIQCEKTKAIFENGDPALLDELRLKTPPSLVYGKRNVQENDFIPRIQPPWLKYDRQVLKFHCYFQESVVENPTENYRLRKCGIYYYLSDGTMHVNEPRTENSGLPQGIFIKRQKIPKTKDSQDWYSWEELNTNMNIKFYERVFRIVGADDFTKEFYEYMGIPLNAGEPMPNDNFEKHKETKDVKIPPPDIKEYNEYNEVKLGGGHPNGGLHQYLENDRRVLSFSILWNDQQLEGGVNYYTLNYFLADGTVEVKEIRKHNSGKDPFPLLLNRKKIPKAPIMTHYPGMTLQKEEYYAPQDLLCGKNIIIYSKECLIYDCDDFTKSWYQQNIGVNQEGCPLPAQEQKKYVQPIPPYNGFGSNEDSLGSVFSLQPKVPRKDINKMYTQDQYILRFEARLLSENREDNTRKFIISFFNGDDTIMAYELADKNSGIWGGKFLERMKHHRPKTAVFYNETDFQIGATIQLSVFRFQLLRADEYTHKYMATKKAIFKEADISYVLAALREKAALYESFDAFLVELVRTLDPNNNGYIIFDELCTGFQKLGFQLNYQEQYTLMRHFDTDRDFKLSIKDFYEGLGGIQE